MYVHIILNYCLICLLSILSWLWSDFVIGMAYRTLSIEKNAATFAAGIIKLSKKISSQIFKEHFGTDSIRHICIPLGAPWVGSCWERTIRIIKDCLKKTIGRLKLDYFKFNTVLSDIQYAVNCRPLTYRCADNNSLEVITPINFLNPYGNNSLLIKNPEAVFQRNKSGKDLAESLEVRDHLVDRFKEIWHKEYLLSLRDSFKDLRQENFLDKIAVGDIVLVRNIQPEFVKRRQYWSLARVLSTIRGHDGKVRSATVLKGSADYQSRKREPELHPVNHLYPLELSLTHNYQAPLPSIETLPGEIAPELDFRNFEDVGETLDEPALDNSNLADFESDGIVEPALASASIPSDLNDTLPSEPSVQFSRRGRRIVPPRGHEDFIAFE